MCTWLQKNFAPVEEIGDHVEVTWTEGEIPADFAEGVFIRNGMRSTSHCSMLHM